MNLLVVKIKVKLKIVTGIALRNFEFKIRTTIHQKDDNNSN